MSLKNIGSAISATGGISQFLSILQSLGGFSFGNMTKLASVISVFEKMKQMTEGTVALKTVSHLMKSFDGSATSIQAVASALSGLKMETATAVLGMTNLNKAQLELVLKAAGVDAAMASETATTIASGAAASGASVGFKALASSMLGAAKAVLVFLATNPVGWLITAGVALLAWTKHVENHNEALREASQAADEYAQSSKETYEKEVEETQSLNDLIDKYKELKRQYEASGELDSDLRSQILDVQSQITDMVGSQADNLDLVNGKLDEELEKLGDIAREQAQQEKEAANVAYKAAVDAAEKAQSLGLKGGSGIKKEEIYDYVGKITEAEKEAFSDAGYNMLFDQFGFGNVGLNFSGDFVSGFENFSGIDVSTAEGKVQAISGMMQTLEETFKDTYADSDLYVGLQAAKAHYQSYVDAIDDSVQGLIDATVKQQFYSDALDKTTVKDAESLETYRKTLIDLVSNDGMIKKRLGEGIIDQEDIEQQVDYYISSMSGLSDYYIEWMNKFDEATVARNDAVKEAFNLTSEADELSEWYDSLPEGEKELVYDIVVNNTDEERQKTIEALDKMSEGGSVNLNLRPTIDTKVLKDAGWEDAGEGAATVFTSTFANKAAENNEKDGIAMNFTPIVTDENGNFVEVLSPEALEKYATGVIDEYERTGILKDEKGLKIGATFDGKDAIANAEEVAVAIHKAQARIYTTPEAKDMTVDSYMESLDAVKEETVNAATIVGESWKGTLDDFDTLWGDDSTFKEGVDSYVEKLDTLKDAIEKFGNGELEISDIISLRKEFKELSKYSNKNLDKGLTQIYKDLLGVGDAADDSTGLVGLFNEQIEELEKQSPETADALKQIRDEYLNLYDLDNEIQLDSISEMGEAVEKIAQMREHLKDSFLTKEDMDDIFANHPEYIQFLQNSAAGMTINTQKASELLKAQGELNLEIADANKYAKELSYQKNLEEMERLAGDAKTLQEILAQGYSDDYADIFKLAGENEALANEIRQWEEYSAEIRNSLSLLQQWQDAQSTSNLGDPYETIKSGLSTADKLYEEGWLGRDDFTSFAMLLARNGATLEEAVADYQANRERFARYLETDTAEEGIKNFWKDAAELAGDYVKYSEEADEFEFNIDSMNEFADAMGVNTEMAEYFLLALKDLGYLDIDLSMIGDSFKESVETMDLNSATAVSDMEHLIDKMGDLESKGVDCSESLPSIASALSQLHEAGVNIDPLISKLEELGYSLEFDEETKEFRFVADTSEVESAESEIEGKELEETVTVDADTDEASAAIQEITQDETKTVTTEVVNNGNETPTNPQSSQGVEVEVVQTPDPLIVNTFADPIEIKQDGTVEIKTDKEIYSVKFNQDGTITVKTDKEEYTVPIKQDGTVEVKTDKETYSIKFNQEGTVEIKTDKETYTVPVDQEGTTNVELTEDEKTISVSADPEDIDVPVNADGDISDTLQEMQTTADANPITVTVNTKGGGFMGEGYETPEIEAPSEENLEFSASVKVDSVDSSGVDDISLNGVVDNLEVSETEVQQIELKADNSQAKEAISETEAELYTLEGTTAQPEIEVDNSQANSAFDETQGKADLLNGTNARPSANLNDYASGAINSVSNLLSSLDGKTATTTVHNVTINETRTIMGGGDGIHFANGTVGSFAKGTVSSFAKGKNISIAKNQVALVNELGEEMLVRDGKASIIQGGAQFINLKRGDIIFNHKQTAELEKYGKVISGSGKGQIALNSGTVNAFYDSTASGKSGRIGGKKTDNSSSSSSSSSSSGSSSSKSSGSSKSSSSKKSSSKDAEKIDWITIAISRAERAIDSLKNAAENIFNTFSTRSKKLASEIDKVTDEIKLQEKAYTRYMKEASSINLSDDLKKKVREGTIDISKYGDDTKKNISEYQKWYEAALKCKDSIDDLNESLSDLYKEQFELIITKWTGKLQELEHQAERTQSIIDRRTSYSSDYVSMGTTRTTAESNIKDYRSLVSNDQEQLAKKQQELNELQITFNELVASGKIKEGSEAYYEMQKSIQDVENEIDALNADIIDNSNNISAAYKTIFDSFQSEYENQISLIEHYQNEVNAALNASQQKGYIATSGYYEALRGLEVDNISKLTKEREKLSDSLYKALASGEIEIGSQAYYDMVKAINTVTDAINDAENEVINLNNEIRQVDWDVFDFLQERISRVSSEANFLIDLLSNSELYDDRGQFSDEGNATVGLRAVNYNTYMKQADDYAKEISKINKDLADNPYDTALIKRREELIDAQQKSITAAEQEKQAIKSLVKEGIEIELSSLKDLIDEYNNALDSAKDLFDYQKKVQDQTSEIAKLEKQLSAYGEDSSEETKAKVQQIKLELEEKRADLEETEYEHYISETKKMLDGLYDEYEMQLNTRLDDINALIGDMIEHVNINASNINQTITDTASSVGYSLSESMSTIWTKASDAFNAQTTSRIENTKQIVGQLAANGILSGKDAEKIVTALGTGSAQDIINTTTIVDKLVAEGKLDRENGDTIKKAVFDTSGKDYQGAVQIYGADFQTKLTTTNAALNNISAYVSQLKQKADAEAAEAAAKVKAEQDKKKADEEKAKAEASKADSTKKAAQTATMTKTTSSATKKETTTTTPAKKTTTTTSQKSTSTQGDGKLKVGDTVKFNSGQIYYSSWGQVGNDWTGYHGKTFTINNLSNSSKVSGGKTNSTGDYYINLSYNGKPVGWVKKDQISGYASGLRKANRDEDAWVDELGTEMIISPTNRAIITHVNKGDTILNDEATGNIWKMANDPSGFINNNIWKDMVSQNTSDNPSVVQQFGSAIGEIVLPNVQSYDDFLNEMKNDKNFEKLIDAIVFSPMNKKSSNSKRKLNF